MHCKVGVSSSVNRLKTWILLKENSNFSFMKILTLDFSVWWFYCNYACGGKWSGNDLDRCHKLIMETHSVTEFLKKYNRTYRQIFIMIACKIQLSCSVIKNPKSFSDPKRYPKYDIRKHSIEKSEAFVFLSYKL